MEECTLRTELARRCRPCSLDEMWGNEAVCKSLKATLNHKPTPQVYLFEGPCGCGKTTLARICCKILKIDEMYITEINASDKNGVDDVRNLIDEMQYKVDRAAYIFDEFHMMSKSAFSAILKPLEEPPEETYIFLCTSESQKLPPAILSRCLRFRLTTLDSDTILDNLDILCRRENIDIDFSVLTTISENCDGTPRNALKLIDKIIGIDKKTALEMIRDNGTSLLIEDSLKNLCKDLFNYKCVWSNIAADLNCIKENDVEIIRRQILGYGNAIMRKATNAKVLYTCATVLSYFTSNFFDSGIAGITLACYLALNDLERIQ